jgi:flavin reductase (DIM6/NTAB) family NADH-FMN oxidoreductase RutF
MTEPPYATFDPAAMPAQAFYRLMIDCIQPRPIALVSTMSADGVANLAPYSFFNGVGSNPPMLVFSTALRRGEPRQKDTLRNIRESGEFVVAATTEANVAAARDASAEYPPHVSEFEALGIATAPARLVRAPLVAVSPVNFECRLHQVVETGTEPGAGILVIGRIVFAHVSPEVLDGDAPRVSAEKLRAVGRMGGEWYCRTTDRFALARPAAPAMPTGGSTP